MEYHQDELALMETAHSPQTHQEIEVEDVVRHQKGPFASAVVSVAAVTSAFAAAEYYRFDQYVAQDPSAPSNLRIPAVVLHGLACNLIIHTTPIDPVSLHELVIALHRQVWSHSAEHLLLLFLPHPRLSLNI